MDFSGKVIVITGASDGIGAELARQLAQERAKLALAARRADALDRVRDECRALGGCQTGDAKITGGHRLSVRHVIHTVGPVWRGGGEGEPDLLTSCYRRSLELARAHQCATVAFPAISTGVYGYPKDQAAHVAVTAVAAFLSESDMPGSVTFCCFDAQTADLHRGEIASLRSK